MAATLADLDAALDAMDATIQASTTAILTAVNDIVKKIGPGIDLSAEVARVRAEAQKVQDATAAVQALDVAPTPSPTP